MRHLALLAALSLAACTAAPPAPSASTAPSRLTKPVATPKATAGPTATPSALAGATPTPAPKPVPLRILAGVAQVEAAYVLGRPGASLISDNGARHLVLGEASAPGAFEDASGASLLSDNGAVLISDNGALLIGNNSGGLISDHGALLVGKAKFGLLQAPAAPPPGDQLPAAGLLVRAYDLETGRAFDLRYPDGSPVFPLATDAAGRFRVPVPARVAGNVLLSAEPPGAADRRLAYRLLAPAQPAALALDEDTALVSAYVREVFAGRLEAFFLAPDDESVVALLATAGLDPAVTRATIIPLRTAAITAGAQTAEPARRKAMATAAADAILARVDLPGIGLSRIASPKWKGPDEPALTALAALLGDLRTATGAKLATPGGRATLEAAPWFVAANARPRAADQPPYALLRGADLGDLVCRAILAPDEPDAYAMVRQVLRAVDLPAGQPGPDGTPLVDTTERFKAAAGGLLAAFALALADEAGAARAKAALEAAAQASAPAAQASL